MSTDRGSPARLSCATHRCTSAASSAHSLSESACASCMRTKENGCPMRSHICASPPLSDSSSGFFLSYVSSLSSLIKLCAPVDRRAVITKPNAYIHRGSKDLRRRVAYTRPLLPNCRHVCDPRCFSNSFCSRPIFHLPTSPSLSCHVNESYIYVRWCQRGIQCARPGE